MKIGLVSRLAQYGNTAKHAKRPSTPMLLDNRHTQVLLLIVLGALGLLASLAVFPYCG